MSIAFSLDRDKPLGVDIDAANKRSQSLAKPLEEPLVELCTLIAEGRTMIYGHNFQSGAELASFLHGAVLSSISFLMEKGTLAKRLPKAATKKADEDKGYL